MSRKLDEAIAENLGIDINHAGVITPYYSTDGNAMLELDREMRQKRYWLDKVSRIEIDEFIQYQVVYWKYQDDPNVQAFNCAEADTMPEAIALASYRALTGKEFKE